MADRITHDGFRVIGRKERKGVRLYSRPGNDLTHRFPLIVESLARLRSRSCIIDGGPAMMDAMLGIAALMPVIAETVAAYSLSRRPAFLPSCI
jgi:ATP-dependent DNA ligase